MMESLESECIIKASADVGSVHLNIKPNLLFNYATEDTVSRPNRKRDCCNINKRCILAKA